MKPNSTASIRATANILRHFRAFIRSDCTRMIDPYSDWHRIEINKKQAQRNAFISSRPGFAPSDFLTCFPLAMTDTTTRRRSGAKPGAKPSGRPVTRNVGVSMYATDEAIAQSIGKGTTSRGVQIALRNFDAALKLLTETKSYVKRTRETWQAAHDDPAHEYHEDAWLLSSIHDADALLHRIDELQATIPNQ